ncbi:MAG: glutathione S-transferase family protein [Pseudomonadota bacterium]
MLTLYDAPISGNCYKVRLLLSFLKIPHQTINVDLANRQQKTPGFLHLNPLGEVPVLQEDDLVLRDSQAILIYLARRQRDESWLPADAAKLAKIAQWLSTASNEIARGCAQARAYHLFNRTTIDIAHAHAQAQDALKFINNHLQTRTWLELERPTIADVACFPYIALVHLGKISLADYPAVEAWVERFKKLPGYITMAGL